MQNMIIKSNIVFLLLLGISFANQTDNTAEEFTINGLKVIVKPNRANEIISAQLYLKGGSRNLNKSIQGIEPLIFESALKGSRNYPKDTVNTILDKTAARIYTNSSRDFTSLNLYCLNRYFDETWKLFSDIIINPSFEANEVEVVRNQLLVDIRQRKDSPDESLSAIADSLFFKNHVTLSVNTRRHK